MGNIKLTLIHIVIILSLSLALPSFQLRTASSINAPTYQFSYDGNGNMTQRTEPDGGDAPNVYSQAWDAENRLTAVTLNSQTTSFVYDGDGQRVKQTAPNGQVTVYLGAYYEKKITTGVATTYYLANGKPVAVRQGSTVTGLHSDHLGSASLTTTPAATWWPAADIIPTARFGPASARCQPTSGLRGSGWMARG